MNFWRRTIRSILDFISFSGMPDQGGHSVKGLNFPIDYLEVEIECQGCTGGRKKMKNLNFFEKFNFYQFFLKFTANFAKINRISNKNLFSMTRRAG